MKHGPWIVLACMIAFSVRASEPAPGLVAHYFTDPVNWNGTWPDTASVPAADPAAWTFTKYEYSRVEPVINHLFIRKGWFSVRWTGFFNPGIPVAPAPAAIAGRINLNPNNSDQNEFTLVLNNGDTITRDDLTRRYAGYSGDARSVHVKPKGNGNQNELTIDGIPFPVANDSACDITAATMTVRLYHDGKGQGAWWMEIAAKDGTITRDAKTPVAAADAVVDDSGKDGHEYTFEVFADDGCRLFLDDKAVIDDWQACSEESPKASRTSKPIRLTNGNHRMVVEYFQGQSLKESDQDPIVVYWSCPARKIQRQIMPAAALSHGEEDVSSSGR